MATFVLVPGAWHGSWAFEAVVPLLERAGHTVHALTLTGLRPSASIRQVSSFHAGVVLAFGAGAIWVSRRWKGTIAA